jgi:hypothetical protein
MYDNMSSHPTTGKWFGDQPSFDPAGFFGLAEA